ncbi:SufE family protein [Salisaeta longa]|uniref:SufE family protein n=1 Tax=Salisaeta longa TaxID=503170 RepID=UPI0003B67319|nr:SufE family protein [Salisaeta longa]
MPTDSSIDARAQQIVDEFALFDDWMGRYEYLIEMGKDIPRIDDAYKTDAHKINGCQSNVWVRADTHDGRLRFTGDSDAMITKGLAALLIRVLDDQPPEAVVQADLNFLDDIGMREHLSSTRNNGLQAMVRQMKARAARLSAA